MRISNERVKKQFAVIYIITLFILIISIVDDGISGTYKNFIAEEYLLLVIFAILLMLFWLGSPLFNYDSDGEVLIIESSEPALISRFVGKHFSVEFPKVKLINFEINELMLRKTLYLYLRGKSKDTVLKTPISYLSGKELLFLEKSLNKVLKNNTNFNKK